MPLAPILDLLLGPVTDPGTVEACYALYRQVFARGFAINVFPLPLTWFSEVMASSHYDVLRLYLKDEPEQPVAVMISHFSGGTYTLSK